MEGQRSFFGRLVDGTRITSDVQTRYADPPGGARDVHHRVEHRRRPFGRRLVAVAAGVEPHRIHRRVDFGDAQDLLDLVLGVPFGDVNGFADEGCGLGQAVRVQVADDHHRGTEQLRRGRGGQPDRSRAGDVDGGTGAHSGGDAAVEPGGKMSDSMARSRIFSSAWSLSGNFRRFQSAYGTSTYSA
jgi:hypothetical protein